MSMGPDGRPWRFDFAVADDAGGTPRHVQLARALVREIQRGRLAPGARLPGSRTLATTLGLNRKVVVAALDELVAQGWLEALPARGTQVAQSLPAMPVADAQPVRARGARVGGTPAGRFTLNDGIPDARLAPLDVIARAQRRALTALGRGGLGYADPAGDPVLREVLAHFVNQARGLSCKPEQVLITRGSQMALSLLALTLVQQGDVVAVESPGYVPGWRAFELAGAAIVHVPVDAHGLVVDALESRAKRLKGRLKAVYVTPHHQYPTTVPMSPERRMHLRALAARYGFTIIEDDYDYEYHFDGTPLLPISATVESTKGSVYVASLSKLIAPAVRLGYIVADSALIARASAVREVLDRQGDIVLERAVAELIEDGELQRHARRARQIYRERRDAMLELLRRDPRLQSALDVRPPAGGLAFWLSASSAVDMRAWAAAAATRGVSFTPGSVHLAAGSVRAFRAGFASFSPDELAMIVDVLGSSLEEASAALPGARR
jgi:GntR family transcriptional regulator / MocR family aminotransferase